MKNFKRGDFRPFFIYYFSIIFIKYFLLYNIVMKLLKTINLRNVSKDEFEKYSTRETARGILLDDNDKVGVIYMSKYDVY